MSRNQVVWRLLGPVEAEIDGRVCPNLRPQQRGVLAFLLLHGNELVSMEQLAGAMWAGAEPPTARAQIHACISAVRHALSTSADLLHSERGGYRITVTDATLDLLTFQSRVAEARQAAGGGRHAIAAQQLTEALSLWRGTPLSGAAGAFVAPAAASLRRRWLAAHEDLADAELALGRYAEVISLLEPLVATHRTDEPLVARLMLALAGSGRQTEALRLYTETRSHLGAEPGGELAAAHLRVLRRHLPVTPSALPPATAMFTGRGVQLAQLDALLVGDGDQQPSTVVIAAVTGTAGVGKTALALHWAHRVAGQFPDGRLYANLRGYDPHGSATDPAAAVAGFLAALHVPPERIPVDTVDRVNLYRSLISGRRMLIVLDNARDVEQVRPLLPGAPGCVVVVTSRGRLPELIAAEGAHPIIVDPMAPPEARELLTRRIGHRRSADEAAAVDSIIASCGGLPLALAIVAARAIAHPTFALVDLASELSGLDGFINIRSVFSWSYRALSAPAARLFRLLGIHPGPEISVPAAASLAAMSSARVRPVLTELADAHLIVELAPGRYGLHDLLRRYAEETARGGERRPAVIRLLDHYLHTAFAATRLLDPYRDAIALPTVSGGVRPEPFLDIHEGLAWFIAEHQALLVLVDLATRTGCDDHAWRLTWTLSDYLDRRGHWHEQVAVHDLGLSAARRIGSAEAQIHGHRGLARAYMRLSRYGDAELHYRDALALSEDDGKARIYLDLSTVAGRRGDPEEALRHAQTSLDLFTATHHRVGQARALNLVGWYHAQLGDHRTALSFCRRALVIQGELGHRHGEAATWDSIGYALHNLDRFEEAISSFQRALDLLQVLGDRYYEADTLTKIGDSHAAAGSITEAHASWRRALDILVELDHADAQRVRAKLPRAAVPPPIVIRTLGHFEVLRDGTPVPWPSLKAREIVKILISRRGQPVARATLKSQLWPDEEHERLGNRLSVALSAARSVLDHGIIATEDAVRIDLGHLDVDVEQFLADADKGLAFLRQQDPRAGDLLARAQARYTGEFLEGDMDKEFASALRGHAGVRYVQVAHALAESAAAQNDHHAAACHLLPVLARDPYDEKTHLALVRILERAGDRGEARRRYRQYVARMAELEVRPAAFPALQLEHIAKQRSS